MMHIQDLPIEIFRLLLQQVALALGSVYLGLQVRLVSKLFAHEMIEAMINSTVMNEVAEDILARRTGPGGATLRIARCPDETIKLRYLQQRAQHEPSGSSAFIDHLRLIASEFVAMSGGKYGYITSMRALCQIVIRTFDLSEVFTNNPALHAVTGESYATAQACLTMACHLGDLDLVTLILKQNENVKINPGAVDHFLSYPIRAAIRGGHKNIVAYLLQNGSRIQDDSDDRVQWTVLHDSVLSNDSEMLEFFLQKKLQFQVWEEQPSSSIAHGLAYEDAIIRAAKQANDIAFRVLLEHLTSSDNAPIPVLLQKRLLMAACEGVSISIARLLFSKCPSLDPNYENPLLWSLSAPPRTTVLVFRFRYTPLQAAAYWGSIPLVELLCDHGADVNELLTYGPNRKFASYSSTPVGKAASQGYARCRDVLLRAGAVVFGKALPELA